MIKSRKINGEHFEFICSKCNNVIDPRYIFDSCCPSCKEKMSSEEGDSATCLGKIAFGCIANCEHARSHTSDCHMFHCKAVNQKVACVYDGGTYKDNGSTIINLEVIKSLVQQGADIYMDNDYALKCAAHNGQPGVVKFLKSLNRNR
jgi:hypothetical protein